MCEAVDTVAADGEKRQWAGQLVPDLFQFPSGLELATCAEGSADIAEDRQAASISVRSSEAKAVEVIDDALEPSLVRPSIDDHLRQALRRIMREELSTFR